MRVDSLEMVCFEGVGIDIPDGSTLGTEFTITTRVRIAKLEQEQVDVSSWEGAATMGGTIHCGLVAVGKPHVTQVER